MKLQKLSMGLLVAALAFAACGPEVLGSRYVKQKNVKASEGAIFTVDATESPELNGTRLELPAGALLADTTVTVELGLTSILGAELAAGPAAVFGPAGTVFSTDVTLVLPVRELNATDDVGIVGLAADGTSFEVDASQVALDATRTRASFRIRQLANYQPRRRAACRADADCSSGLQCVNGRCRVAPPASPPDGGSAGCPMSCPSGSSCDPASQVCVVQPTGCTNTMNCPTNFACVNGACQPPMNNSCGMGTACPSGQACFSGRCVPIPGDGGSSNPNACMADGDCSMNQRCVNGACQTQCVPVMESCNQVDDDCDGLVDEGCNTVDAGADAGTDAGVDAGVSCSLPGNGCPSGLSCVDDPADMCVPNMGTVCGGICVSNTPAMDGGSPAIDGGSPNPGMCRSSAECMGTVCVNGFCQ